MTRSSKPRADLMMWWGILVLVAVLLSGLWISLDVVSRKNRECPQIHCTCSCDGESAVLDVEPR